MVREENPIPITTEQGDRLSPIVKDRENEEVSENADYTSSSGSSSSESEEDDDNEDEDDRSADGPDLPFEKPQTHGRDLPNAALKSRLTAFLPELERSNRELTAGGAVQSRRIDDVDEKAERWVEMDLHLGVLSPRDPSTSELKVIQSESDDSNERASCEHPSMQILSERPKSNRNSQTKRKIEEL